MTRCARSELFSKQRIFEQGECPRKLLAYLAHLDSRPPVVITLRSDTAGVITDPALIVREFADFVFKKYAHLRLAIFHRTWKNLGGLTLPKLTKEQADMLEAPLSTDDIKLALSHFEKVKAPGSDGLPIKFYAHFSDTLIPRLLALY